MRKRFSLLNFIVVTFIFFFFILFPLLNHKGKVDANSRQSVTYTKEEFIQKIVPDAQDLGKSYGIRPSFIIAQAALDSNFGEKLLANKYHNLFGLLAKPGTPAITLNDSSTGKKQEKQFIRYKSWKYSMYDYLAQIKSGATGKKDSYTIMVSVKNSKTLVQKLQDSGFDSDKKYAKKMTEIIDLYDLTRYDK
ncbi:glycoside hydrolase family 73 protein [Streptococcus agalactiae]|uniref:glycoside hydrolase family 73 protein n=1 Tax=Streptococcus agalactiae TaxID=1311 RepID=UPI003C77BFD9